MKESLVATGQFGGLFDGEDKWTDKDTGERQTRQYRGALLEFVGGKLVVREPYTTDDSGVQELNKAFAQITAGQEVAVPVRLSYGHLELVSGGKPEPVTK